MPPARPRHRAPRIALGGTLVGAGLFATATALFAEYVVNALTEASPPREKRTGFTPFETGVDWEEVSFPTEGGMTLNGWFFKGGGDAPAVLACGGYRGNRADLLGISSNLWRAGFNVLLFDYRGHGGQPGDVTLGYRELEDARAALRYLRERRPEAPLGAIGFSMGASVAIMLAAREHDVRALVADSPFTSQREIVRFRMARHVGLNPSRLTAPLAAIILSLVDRRLAQRFGFRLTDVQPLRDMAQLALRPVLLIHGEDDQIIPVDHSHRMERAGRNAGVRLETWYVPGAWHCGAYFLDRPRYCDRVARFFSANLLDAGEVCRERGRGARSHAE